jgi:putative MATE family efflux protein
MAEVGTVRRGGQGPRFVTGSLLRHILAMTAAGAVGLMAIFIGDLANIYFLSRIGDEAIVAAVGYASSILFFSTSIGIGLSIAATSLVAPALGARRRVRARRLSANAHVLAFLFSAAASIPLWFAVRLLLELLGASGRTLVLASFYLDVLLPTLPLLSLGMTSAAVLRSVGDARRAMHVTLSGAVINTILDLIFIVHFGLGIEGAVLSTLLARFVVMGVGFYGVVSVHDLMGRPKIATLKQDASDYSRIAAPAVLTNIAPAVGNAYVTYAIAAYGDAAVAAWAIIGRIIPVAFGAIYALSGTVGPILGQNFGARSPSRMRDVYTLSLLTMVAFTGAAWLILALSADPLAALFKAGPEARGLMIFFCRWLSPLFVFLGTVFITSAVFNTLGRAHFSTLLGWGRATLGTVPFVILGGNFYGPEGVLAGNMVGGVAFGLIAVIAGYRLIARVGETLRL